MRLLEYAPTFMLLPVAGGIATFLLFMVWRNHREIRGRVLPLWVLTLLHTLALLLFFCMAPHDVGGLLEIAGDILGWIYLFGIPVFPVFIFIYAVALGDRERMTRHVGLAVCVFTLNDILQTLLILLAFFLHPGLLE